MVHQKKYRGEHWTLSPMNLEGVMIIIHATSPLPLFRLKGWPWDRRLLPLLFNEINQKLGLVGCYLVAVINAEIITDLTRV